MRILWLMVLIPAALCGQTPSNLGFESTGTIGLPPPSWVGYSVVGSGFWFSLTNQGCFDGRQCAMIGGPANPQSNWYGLLYQSVGPAPYSGRGFRMKAAVRVEGAGTSVRLWVGDGASLNVMSTAITSNKWQYYTLEDRIGNPSYLSIGFVILGSGSAWIDDISFTAVRNDAPEAPNALSDTGLANITAFAKVLGYVRHFHPSDQSLQVPWNSFAIDGIRSVEGAATAGDLASRLHSLFAPTAPTVQIFATGAPPALHPDLRPASADSLQLVRWNNYGVGVGGGSNIYSSTRQSAAAAGNGLPEGFQDPAQPYEAEIGRGLSVRVPLSLYQDAQGTLPHVSYSPSDCCMWSVDDRASRMGGVIVAWNVAQHFYPYFDVVQTDWPAALTAALRSAATDSGADDYFRTLSLMWAALKDGHGSVQAPLPSYGVVPLEWQWVENQLVVTQVTAGLSQGIVPGDRILAIDGMVAGDAIAAKQPLISGATPQWILYRTLSALAKCAATGSMRLDYEPYASPGSPQTAELTCQNGVNWSVLPGNTVRELEPGIMYADLNRLTDADWAQVLPQLASAAGIVFDLRGYPKTLGYLENLSGTPMDSAQWHVPMPQKPDQVDLTLDYQRWSIPPATPYLGAKRVFLTDGRAISFAETVMGIVENYRLAEIVGATTAGTNGNINIISLPGGFSLVFTGMKVLKHNGSQHHGVGIHPTIQASRTRQGVAAGRDEVLERGVQVLKGAQAGPSIAVSNTQLRFYAVAGGAAPPAQSIGVSNSGGGTLSWTTSSSVPWLTLTSTSTGFTVSADPAGLSVGPQSGTILVTAPGATDNPQTVSVMLTISSLVQMPSPTAARFVPIVPCRIADTRNTFGPFGGPTLPGKTARDFAIPSSSCGIPGIAVAYSMNVAVVPSGPLGFLTLWPAGQPQPLVATLNSDGRIKSNAAVVPAGASGAISVFVSDATDVVLDINGYFVAGDSPAALAFYPLTPCRIADTRNPTAPLGGPNLAAQSTRSFPILASPCGLPPNAQAYSLNFAAVPKGSTLGFLTAWPAGQSQPLVASLNDPTGTVLANAVVVPAGAGGAVNVFTTDATDLVIDINGYFAPQGPGGLSLYTVPPCRVLDSRVPAGTLPFSSTRDVNITAAPCGVPASAQAFVFNATVVPPGPLGYITMWPHGQTQPLAATLNASDGAITNNMAIVPATTGSVSVFPLDPTHLVLDIFGFFAP